MASLASAVDAPQAGDEIEVFERRQAVIDHRLVGQPGHQPLGTHRVGQDVDAENRDRPAVRFQQPGRHPQRSGLAGAIGAEEDIEFAYPHAQIQSVDRRPAEGLGKPQCFESEPAGYLSHLSYRDGRFPSAT